MNFKLKYLFLIPLIVSCMTKDSEQNNSNEANFDYSASSSQIVWISEKDAESFIKNILEEKKINYKNLESQNWDPETSTIGKIRDYKLSMVASAGNSWKSLLLHLNSNLANTLASEISKNSTSPVIVFLEFDQTAWGYAIYKKGKLINTFCNDPDMAGMNPEECIADTKLLIESYKVTKDSIAPYLVNISETENLGKVFPNDEFELETHWVRVDFMKKLGIIYPDNGQWLHIIEKDVNE